MVGSFLKADGARWSWVKPAAAVWGAGLVLTGVCYATWKRKIDVHSETGPLEAVQLASWILAVIVAGIAVIRAGSWRDRMSAGWLCVVAALATAREMDLHEAVQKGTTWLPPVHFRVDWITDTSQPIGPKIFWLTLFAAVGFMLAIPPLLTKAPTVPMLRKGDGATWLVLISFAFLGAGYLADDVFGRGNIGIHYEVTQGMEEVFELCGALAFVMACWWELRMPLSHRAAAFLSETTSSSQ